MKIKIEFNAEEVAMLATEQKEEIAAMAHDMLAAAIDRKDDYLKCEIKLDSEKD